MQFGYKQFASVLMMMLCVVAGGYGLVWAMKLIDMPQDSQSAIMVVLIMSCRDALMNLIKTYGSPTLPPTNG